MIALKCLQKPAELRYATADELADDLEAYLADEPISARSGRFTQIMTRAFRETHHAAVLENWGLLWMLHAAVLLVLCLVTNAFQLAGITSRWPYVALWTVGLGTWAAVFWNLRRRSGPITFVERQIAHVWAGSMIIDMFMYAIEYQLGLAVLTLSPMLGPISGAVFLTKAAMLSGVFYIQAVVLCLTGLAMAWLQTQHHIPNSASASSASSRRSAFSSPAGSITVWHARTAGANNAEILARTICRRGRLSGRVIDESLWQGDNQALTSIPTQKEIVR